MPIELISMLAGGLSGFVMNFMSAQAENQARTTDNLMRLQGATDDSNDRAAKRGSAFGRRVLLFGILWLIALAPLVGALLDIPTFVEGERAPWDLLGLFSGGWERLEGIVVMDEVRAGFTACVGFWLGGAAVGEEAMNLNYEVITLLETIGSAAQPVIAFAIWQLCKQWSKFDKSITLLSHSVEDLGKRIERIENHHLKGD